jgi:[glutamine synthetase] adenylyltransferase / [glutamine synthetase]-adenylyl-L-tyrosine phosphorylase
MPLTLGPLTLDSAITDSPILHQVIDRSADPQRVAHYLHEFGVRRQAELQALEEDPELLHRLAVIFGVSRFLSEELLRYPDWLWKTGDLTLAFSRDDYKERLDAFLSERGTVTPTALDLALFRRRELVRIVLRDRMGIGTLAEIAGELSHLADTILGRVLACVTAEVTERHGYPVTQSDGEYNGIHNGNPAALTLLALGKLGGSELNYSSDVDLMFLYSANGETSGPKVISNKEFFKKVANRFTNLLSTHTAAGLCYRVDLRLRPEGTLGEVCLSLDAAKQYYSKRARDWELQMLIKARVTAGDEALGQALLDFVEPSIYSTTLDFSTIETMSETRERISEKLTSRRLGKAKLDVKLARGGIRDVEFLVQCLQRLHGAREMQVRQGGTLLALEHLHERDLLSTTEHARLVDAYEYFRRVEHLLQLEDDRQTHALPSHPQEMERLARRMHVQAKGVGAASELLRDINQRLENVQVIYERIVHAQRPTQHAPTSMVESARPLPCIDPERKGLEVSPEALEILDAAAPHFMEALQARGVHRSGRLLADFLEALSKQPQQLELLNNHPLLADWTMQVFEVSPHLGAQLARYPELLEEIRRAVDHPTRRWAFEGLAAPLSDIGGLRRFFRREMFRIQVGSICMPEPVFATLDRTSALAEFVIARAYRIALESSLARARDRATAAKPFREPQDEMMVVALGRLGMREFDLASDADLLFILPDSEAHRQPFWTRVAEHLIETLTTYTGDGAILSIDTRLRPNGREGMLVQTESKYVEYFSLTAEAWEGIAYMKARGVAGDTDRATTFLNELQNVDWRRYGQGGRSKYDLRQMRMRLQREQGHTTPLKAAEGGYYDADFILMYLRLKGAGMFFKSLNTPERIDVVEKMGHLDNADAAFLLQATTYFRAVNHALRLVTGRAEERIPAAPEQREMIAALLQRWTGRQCTAVSLDTDLLAVQMRMRRLFEVIFS